MKLLFKYTILKYLSLGLIATVIMLLVTSCKVVDQSRVQDSDTDTIPWNTRAGWENSSLGVPY